MANDLNFDELDEAVNDYMSKSSRPTPVSSHHEIPVSEAHKVEAQPLPTPTIERPERPAPGHAASAHAPRLQLQPRQTLAARRSSGVTFHDIAPPKRFSTAPSLHPPTEARPVAPPSGHETPLESPELPRSEPPAVETKDEQPVIKNIAPKPVEEPPELASLREELAKSEPELEKQEETAETEMAEAIGTTAAVSEIEPPEAEKRTEDQDVKILSDNAEAEAPESQEAQASEVTDDKFLYQGTDSISDALLDDLKGHAKEIVPPPAVNDEAKISFGNGEEKMGTDVGNGLPAPKKELDLIEEPSPVENKGGLMNTGELHANNLLGDSHESNQNSTFGQDPAAVQSGGVFDTKEYHTPIEQHPKETGGKAMGIIVAIILLIVIGVGAFAAYTVFFASTSL